jgi:hypothetical protein
MQHLKDKILKSPALQCLDYESGHEVILAVDTSVITVGFILFQEGEDGKRYPNRFGSITLTEVESCYSQVKLELYGLFHALRAVWIFIFGIANLTVEMDAKYVKGMIKNPDLQPKATINRWIAGILLFHFKLMYISVDKHKGPDGLSRRPHSGADPPKEDDFEDWLDDAYSFAIVLLNERPHPDLYSRREKDRCYSHICLPIYYSRFHPTAAIHIQPRNPHDVQVYSNNHARGDYTLLDADTSTILRSARAKAREDHIR